FTDSSGLQQMGIDYCVKDNRGRHGEHIPKPLGPCPNGGTAVCVTCYGSDAAGGGGIGYPSCCGTRPPSLGDCALDNDCAQCNPGDYIGFGDFGTGQTIGTTCRACDTGAG